MIRELELSDLESLLALYTHLHESDDPLPEAIELRAIGEAIMADPNITYFGIDHQDHVIASCHLVIVPNLTRGAKPYGLIENVVTHPDYRRHGHATQLLRHTIDYAWQQGCYKVMLMTGRQDDSVYNLYEKAGFRQNIKEAFIAYPKKIASDNA